MKILTRIAVLCDDEEDFRKYITGKYHADQINQCYSRTAEIADENLEYYCVLPEDKRNI